MLYMNKWNKLATQKEINEAIKNLKANGFNPIVVEKGAAAKKKVFEILPKGAEVMTASSQTLEELGITKQINEGGGFNSVKAKLTQMDRNTQGDEMQKLGAAPEWVIGSVHAVTQDGHVLIASNSGSQLPSYSYGASHVLWVVGTQKLVKDTNMGIRRIYEYCLPLEDKRAQKIYGSKSGVSKLLIINKENKEGRITLILVKENLGF